MRVGLVPDDELTEHPEIGIREPKSDGVVGAVTGPRQCVCTGYIAD